MRQGLESVVPRAALALLSWRSLERGVCGERRLTLEALKGASRVELPEPMLSWFWQAVEEFRRARWRRRSCTCRVGGGLRSQPECAAQELHRSLIIF